ncbi:hypothetical protein BT63DRAFT_429898 [Microthyrium microscopicum]|uniref:Uncharacterized protein n=1 Tax=Microthyrium microscopicum TaxID=703497 RepID=A0A6A6TWA0_9PEZI|nr:hypothetical protein BT63DRAFT_429898 [Microthyrium microscopicum]
MQLPQGPTHISHQGYGIGYGSYQTGASTSQTAQDHNSRFPTWQVNPLGMSFRQQDTPGFLMRQGNDMSIQTHQGATRGPRIDQGCLPEHPGQYHADSSGPVRQQGAAQLPMRQAHDPALPTQQLKTSGFQMQQGNVLNRRVHQSRNQNFPERHENTPTFPTHHGGESALPNHYRTDANGRPLYRIDRSVVRARAALRASVPGVSDDDEDDYVEESYKETSWWKKHHKGDDKQ